MKNHFKSAVVAVGLVLGLAPGVFGYTNNQNLTVVSPAPAPQINDPVFVNNSVFSLLLESSSYQNPAYETYNTRFYSNAPGANLFCNIGFRFQNIPTQSRNPFRSETFVNRGTIAFSDPTNLYYSSYSANSAIIVNATNVAITNGGTIIGGEENLIQLSGRDVDLTRGTLRMSGYQSAYASSQNILDGYWGLGTSNRVYPAQQFENPPYQASTHQVMTRSNVTMYPNLSFSGPAYVYGWASPVGIDVNAVFLRNTNIAVTPTVYLQEFGYAYATFAWLADDTTNYLHVFDSFGSETNLSYYTNYTYNTLSPANYSLYISTNSGGGTVVDPGTVPQGLFSMVSLTNDWAAYGAILSPSPVLPYTVPGRTVTNLPGRVELHADRYLNLNESRVSASSTIYLRATNHFSGVKIRKIMAPYYSIELGSTNGRMVISNLVSGSVPCPDGTVALWSTRWQEATDTATNRYHVVFIDSQFNTSPQPMEQDVRLYSTNSLILNDSLVILSNLLITAERVTINTNPPGSVRATGGLSFLDPSQSWPNNFPRMHSFTNYGPISAKNSLEFRGVRSTRYYPTAFVEPYRAFVNHGNVAGEGIQAWAGYFVNDAVIYSRSGDTMVGAASANLNNGTLVSAGQSIFLTTGSLMVSNTTLMARGGLFLNTTNVLDDGSLNNDVFKRTNGLNKWSVGNDGVQLTRLPAQASLLTTTITNKATVNVVSPIIWSGRDLGANIAGYSNNAALGRLVLDGEIWSQFAFQPAVAGSALYVDVINLAGYAATLDDNGNFPGLTVDPGMKVYFADARINGSSVAEKLNGASEGRFVWLGAYAGPFSSSLFVYPDGTTNRINTALASSCFIDTDNDGLVNCIDPHPVNPWLSMTAVDQKFTIRYQKTPAPAAVLTWFAPSNSYNWVFSRPALTNQGDAAFTNWTVLRQFGSGPLDQMVSVTNLLYPTNQFRYYRVRVDKP